MNNGRILIYTCCDGKYSHFIPLFCASALYYNQNIDIEIGVDIPMLTDGEESALNYIRSQYPDSRILIRYNMFEMKNGKAIYNGKTMMPNTVRFVSEPVTQDEYVYISDIDIPIMETDFHKEHLNHMSNLGLEYSNMVRKGTKRLTGLHFTMFDSYYPIRIGNEIDLSKNDEMILFDIVEGNGTKIDKDTMFRPVHGIHFSPNRPYVGEGHSIVGWGADKFKTKWYEFVETELYKHIETGFHDYVKRLIAKLDNYYNGNEPSPSTQKTAPSTKANKNKVNKINNPTYDFRAY